MKLKTVLKGRSHQVVIYENDDDSEAYLEYYYSLFNNVTQSHHNLISFLLEKTAEWYISEQGERAEQFFENLQRAASSADWGVATVNVDDEEWSFPYPIPTIGDKTIVLSDWMGNEIEVNRYQAGVVLLAFLFQRGEGPEFFRRQMLTGNPYKDWEQTDEPPVALLVRTIADENHWDDVFRILD